MALSGLKKRTAEAPQEADESAASSATDNEGDDLSSSDGAEAEQKGNAGWADSIAKVLNTTKPKSKKTLVLSRAKKNKTNETSAATKTKDYGFEIEGEIKEEKPDKDELSVKLKQRKNLPLALRVKPTWKDIERERALRKIATKGVVQLFNAVRMQQKDLKEQLDAAGPLDSRREAVLNNINKRKFLDVLMGGSRAKSERVDNPVKFENTKEEDSTDDSDDQEQSTSNGKKKAEWDVFREDFMTNKKIKHWDEEDDDSDANNAAEGSDDAESDEEQDED